jgi:hypothetical protein
MSKIDEIFNDIAVITQEEEPIEAGCSPKLFDFKWLFFLTKNENINSDYLKPSQLKTLKKNIENILDYSRFIRERTRVFFVNRSHYYNIEEKIDELNLDEPLDSSIRYIEIVFAFNGSIRDIFSFVQTLCLIKKAFIYSTMFHYYNINSFEISLSDGSEWKIDDRIYMDDFPYSDLKYDSKLISNWFKDEKNVRKIYKVFTYMAGKHDRDYIEDGTIWIQKHLEPRLMLDAFDPEIGHAMAMKPSLAWMVDETPPRKLKIKNKKSRFFWQFFATAAIGMCHYNTEYYVVDEINKAIADGRLSKTARRFYSTTYKDIRYTIAYMGRIFIKQELSHIDVSLIVSEKLEIDTSKLKTNGVR